MDGGVWQSCPCTGGGVVWAHVQIIEVVKVVHEGDASGSRVHGRGVFCREHLITGTSVSSLYCVSDGMTAGSKVYEHPLSRPFLLPTFAALHPVTRRLGFVVLWLLVAPFSLHFPLPFFLFCVQHGLSHSACLPVLQFEALLREELEWETPV